jgi:hypothetical protein
VKVEDEVDVVATPGVSNLFNLGNIFNTTARTGFSPYFFLDRAGPSAPPLAHTGPMAPTPVAATCMKEKALPGPPPAELLPTRTLRRNLGRKMATLDRRPSLRRTGAWNPVDLGLPSAEVLNMAVGANGFYSPDEGESSSN